MPRDVEIQPIAIMHGNCAVCVAVGEPARNPEEDTLILLALLAAGRHTVAGLVASLCEPHHRELRRLVEGLHAKETD